MGGRGQGSRAAPPPLSHLPVTGGRTHPRGCCAHRGRASAPRPAPPTQGEDAHQVGGLREAAQRHSARAVAGGVRGRWASSRAHDAVVLLQQQRGPQASGALPAPASPTRRSEEAGASGQTQVGQQRQVHRCPWAGTPSSGSGRVPALPPAPPSTSRPSPRSLPLSSPPQALHFIRHVHPPPFLSPYPLPGALAPFPRSLFILTEQKNKNKAPSLASHAPPFSSQMASFTAQPLKERMIYATHHRFLTYSLAVPFPDLSLQLLRSGSRFPPLHSAPLTRLPARRALQIRSVLEGPSPLPGCQVTR